MKHKHFIVFCVFVFLFCIIYICLNFINIDKNLLYSTNKLYAILDEQYRPGFAGAVENPRVAQLGKTDKKIVFELVDATHETEPYKDTFYAILTEDKNLKYYNGYIFPSRIVNGLGEGETLDILGLSNLKKTDANGRFTLQSGLFEFQILYKEYSVKLTDLQYVKIIYLKQYIIKYVINYFLNM